MKPKAFETSHRWLAPRRQGVSDMAQGYPRPPKDEGGGPAVSNPTIDPLARLGRNSLFIYWIHVELVYGYASWMWRHRLPLWGTAIAFVLFCMLMYRAIGWRDTAAAWWRNRPRGAQRSTQTATA